MLGTVIPKPSINARERAGGVNRAPSIDEWRTFCGEVREAAEQLRQIAARAELAASSSNFDNLARDFGIPTIAPAAPKAKTYATMMLGPFAALEELRRQIRD